MNPLLYGSNGEENLVAVQPVGDRLMRLYFRRVNGGITSTDENFYPFFFVSTPSYLEGFAPRHWVKKLSGENHFNHICAFNGWSDMWDAVRHMLSRYESETSTSVESFAELPFLHLRPDAVSQFLLETGRTLFKGMDFGDVHRLQLDIETYSPKNPRGFSNAERPEDRITVIALSDSRGWEEAITGRELTEKEMLEKLIAVIREKDPDVIEGHNIYNFDLPYILKRCELHGVEPAFGRDGSAPRSFDSRTSFAERAIEYSAHEIPGRHIVDTWLLLQAYDVSKRTLESYGLKYAAKHFGFAREDGLYLRPDRISWYWDNEPDLLVRYALDDVRETRQLSEHLSPSTFYVTQMIPYNFGTAARMGSAAKIESLLLREYVRQKHSVPQPEPGMQTSGGYADIFYTGVLGPVVDADVESLYPSIMIADKIAPARESLGIFTSLLENLTRMRLEAKRRMKESTDRPEIFRHDAMQSSFKILINSFYGYLGYSRGLFNDMEAADAVTRRGQMLLRQLIEEIGIRGGKVAEVDTDGIFFVPPPAVRTEKAEREFVEKLPLPKGITLLINGRFKKMLSYKMKNYALLGYDDRIRIKGSSLISRNIEKFGRNFIQACIDRILNGNIAALHELYASLHRDIAGRKLAVGDFSRTETLKETAGDYSSAVELQARNRAASYEVALAAGLDWKPGDKITYYITGADVNIRGFENCKLAEEWNPSDPDENIAYYLRRLDEFSKKFEPFFTARDFHAIFSVDDLFGFSPAGIKIQTLQLDRPEEPAEERIEPKIWLDQHVQ